jgi:hypothetical protein
MVWLVDPEGWGKLPSPERVLALDVHYVRSIASNRIFFAVDSKLDNGFECTISRSDFYISLHRKGSLSVLRVGIQVAEVSTSKKRLRLRFTILEDGKA